MTKYSFRGMHQDDAGALLDILNYYIQNSTAHFSDKPRDISYINNIINSERRLPQYIIQREDEIIGFGYAYYAYRPEKSFADTVKFTYWLKPEYTGQGLGKKLYSLLEKASKALGIKHILVNISSENTGSINFHEKQGFLKCGHFRKIANKKDKLFDIIWLQKTLT